MTTQTAPATAQGTQGTQGQTAPVKTEERRPPDVGRQAARAVNALAKTVHSFIDSQKAAQAAKPEKAPDPVYTRRQLRAAVEKGAITEDDMDAILEKQDRDRIAREVDERVQRTVGNALTETQTSDNLERYADNIPALHDKGSAEWQRVNREYLFLTRECGLPEGPKTELVAARSVFGDLKQLRRPGRRPRGDFQDMGGAGGGGDRALAALPGLTADQRAWYQQAIQKGLYSGPDDPKLKRQAARLAQNNQKRRAA